MLFIHPEDLAALGLQDGERVEIETLWNDGVVRKVDGFKLVSYDIPRGNLAAYYPETNPLVPLASFGDGTGTPTSKSIRWRSAAANGNLRCASPENARPVHAGCANIRMVCNSSDS